MEETKEPGDKNPSQSEKENNHDSTEEQDRLTEDEMELVSGGVSRKGIEEEEPVQR